jgi:3-deoxy-7-phosphoheptulonate synthase
MQRTYDLNVHAIEPLTSPRALKDELPMRPAANETVVRARDTVTAILARRDPRLLVIVGPCSIHDEPVALEYAGRLAELAARVRDEIFVIMRVYFEKPRTTVGWRGMIIDPHLDYSSDIPEGLRIARRILLAINEQGLPTATEVLDPIVPQYTADLVAWAAVGARTTESQTHREMASGLSMPVGFKNSTDGNLQVAIDAIVSARDPHRFLGLDQDGRIGVVSTRGNRTGHAILRGGRNGTNYDGASVQAAAGLLERAGLPPALMVDCSHDNSGKKHENQETAWDSVISQRAGSTRSPIVGVMLESNLFEGRQDMPDDPRELRYGVSITDECISWDTTERMLTGALRAHQGQTVSG